MFKDKKEMNLKNLLGIFSLLAILLAGCAKELPVEMDAEVQRDVYPISLFTSGEVVLETTKEGDQQTLAAASNDVISGTTAVKKLLLRNTKFVSGDQRLAPFFKDLKIESERAGEKFKISFRLTGNFLIAYINVDEHALSVQRHALMEGTKAPLFQYNIGSYGIVEQATNSLGEKTRDLVFHGRNQAEATHVQVSSIVEKRQMIGDNIAFVDKVFTNRARHFDTDAVYLYVPMTQGTPRAVAEANPFYQGGEKLVKIKFTEEGLEAFEIEKDRRFRDNDLNNFPVFTIPGTYKDFKCERDEYGRCKSVATENTRISWKEKQFFLPDLEGIKTQEVNPLDLFVLGGNSCVQEVTKPKMVDYTIKKGVINIELEKTFKLSSNIYCIIDNYLEDTEGFSGLSTAGFKVRYFYSLVKLEDLATENYKPIDYPLPDHDVFGFFKTKQSKLNGNFDPSRKDEKYFLNRWNPERKEVVYYLSDTFNKPMNKLFKDASFKAIDSINKAFKKAGSDFKIILKNPAGKKAGDLRYNVLQLIDDPLANGLLGYAPTVANPLTGEILQGHVNMYSGNLRSMSRHVWESMADHTENNLKEKNTLKFKQLEKGKLASQKSGINFKTIQDFSRGSKRLENLVHNNGKDAGKIIKKKAQMAMWMEKQRIKNRRLKNFNDNQLSDFEKNAKKKMSKLDFWAENNALSTEFFTIAGRVKTLIPGIKDIDGVFKKNGTLKRWKDLTNEQKEKAITTILPYTYTATLVHEFGHNLGLRHNFAGSFDADNFFNEEEAHEFGLNTAPAYSSIMDYAFNEMNELRALGKYDIAALKFAYARKVEVKKDEESEEMMDVSISSTIEDFDAQSGQTRKEYQFCTDSNAGLSSSCNRFDEGSTLVEVVNHYIQKYQDFYKYRNFRDNRNSFQAENLGGYTVARYHEFNRIRGIFEEWEFFTGLFGLDAMMAGCSDEDAAKYPVCKMVNDRRDAVKIAGDFFLDVLKTPDHLCATMTDDEEKTVNVTKLSDVYEEIKYTIDGVPTSCFHPKVVEFLAKDKGVVFAEAGKFLNGIKDTNPYYPYSNDRAVLGTWVDKLLAMKALVQRKSGRPLTEKTHMAMSDHGDISEKLTNFLDHISKGYKLSEPKMFTAEDGTPVPVDYKIDSDYVINGPQDSIDWVKKFFELPESGKEKLNKATLNMLNKWAQTDDLDFKLQGVMTVNYTSVRKADIQEGFQNAENMDVFLWNDIYYGATEFNPNAQMMIRTINYNLTLPKFDKKNIETVVDMKENPDYTRFSLSEDEQKIITIDREYIKLFQDYRARNLELKKDIVLNIFGEDIGNAILTSYDANNGTFKKLLEVMDKAQEVPPMVNEEIKELWDIHVTYLKSFLSGKLEEKAETFKFSLEILNDSVSTN